MSAPLARLGTSEIHWSDPSRVEGSDIIAFACITALLDAFLVP